MDAPVGRIEQTLLQRCLDELVKHEVGLKGAMFCSSDGFELASNLPKSVTAASLAAMASSQFALGDAMCKESGLKHCQELIMDGSAGSVLLLAVPGSDRTVVLAAISNAKNTLGQVLYACKQAVDGIGARFGKAHR
ncbi:MAG TPA: roadblock/LC7 domain-containing protein [Rhodanobacteraceae bacterium]|nr:roadblock/LC7 domain-containing protein [Rhodanobacteraceae bacterium]